jgi:hypothetical protein
MKLWILVTLMGLGLTLTQAYGLWKPAEYGAALRNFPRSMVWGYALMILGTAGFLWNVRADTTSDYAPFKPALLVGFGVIGVGCCIYVRDSLAVRGLAVVALLLAKVVLDSARWVDTQWRLVVVVMAYVWIICALVFVSSPWRLRDLIQQMTANEQRTKAVCMALLLFGLLLVGLGASVFRTAR